MQSSSDTLRYDEENATGILPGPVSAFRFSAAGLSRNEYLCLCSRSVLHRIELRHVAKFLITLVKQHVDRCGS